MPISPKDLALVKKMYNEGASVRQIAEHYQVSLDSAYYFFRKNKIERRTAGQNNTLAFQRKENTFTLKENLTAFEKELKVAGAMLYWGEGSQWRGEKIVDFANSNPGMVQVFLSFLRRIYQINESKLRAYLYCYSNQNVSQLLQFWSQVTKIPTSQFTKPYIRQDFRVDKDGKMRYGVVHIRYNDKKLLNQIRDLIQEYKEKLA